MDKAKGVLKGGWHPAGDPKVHRDTWKSDLKGIATGKTPEKKQLEASRNHTSAPLSALKDPESFGPPPKHTGAIGSSSGTPTSPTRPRPPAGGLGGPVPAPKWRQEEQQAQEETVKAPPVPYRTDTTGLTTNNLPTPPVRRAEGNLAPPPAPPARNTSPASPVSPVQAQQVQPQQQQPPPRSRPMPALPPRMNDHPDEFTPPPPPSYTQATQPVPQPASPDPALLNPNSLSRLSQAGISVPGFGIGNNNANANTGQTASNSQGHTGQLSELQQRFSRMNTGSSGQSSVPPTQSASSTLASAAAANPRATAAGFNTLATAATSNPRTANSGFNTLATAAASNPRATATGFNTLATAAANNPRATAAASNTLTNAATAAYKKPAPPPPPPKKAGLADGTGSRPSTADGGSAPPPLPLSSKPRPP